MILSPATEGEAAAAVRDAPGPLELRGGGTRPLGRPLQAEATLDLSRLSGIALYEPGALTLVARAGTPVAEIEAALAAEGQMLPFEPMDHRALLGSTGEPTIGGAMAVGASGPRRVSAGSARDYAIGLRFVTGAGEVVKSGGRVMKNVTGLDLARLLCGAHGTLGAITEVALKVLPRPEAETTLVARGLPAKAGVAALSAALGTPFGVSGAAHLGTAEAAETRLRLEGTAPSVAYRAEALRARLGGDWERVEGPASAALWRALRDLLPFAGRAGAVWRVSLRPTDGPRLAAALAEAGLAHEAVYDWGGGLVSLLVAEAGDAGAATIRAAVAALGGHATLLRGAPALRAAVRVFPPEAAPVAALSAGLRAKFDPRGILNPGRMG